MAYLLALLIFVALSSACWFVSVACAQGTGAGPDPAAAPHYRTTAAAAIGAAVLTSFIPFPAGYLLGLVGWAVAAFTGLGLTAGRAAVLFGYLAASSYAARLVVGGVMEMMGS
ncbi:hypothetical protein [Urbifossiella limnaea]|uniref:Uncharacterized protein n=1 Tax=Urbifossiella limnaea TaxID=2528023 RepID=A0A517XW43_9BACT|nr:hypothetical protein [Urbifossiella limnaea]QDU21730.1 hypothetical protein ETAA1_37030 [Urbifossiella limnaea]